MMKKLLILALCLLLLCLCACGPKVSKGDPFSYVVKEWHEKIKDDGEIYYDGVKLTAKYALIDIDENGGKALLLDRPWFYEVYTIQDGVAVLQQSFKDDPGGHGARLQKNGVIRVDKSQEKDGKVEIVDSFYRFENGELKLQAELIMGIGYCFHIPANGVEISITREEYHQLSLDYAGDDYKSPDLDWKPLAEYGR